MESCTKKFQLYAPDATNHTFLLTHSVCICLLKFSNYRYRGREINNKGFKEFRRTEEL